MTKQQHSVEDVKLHLKSSVDALRKALTDWSSASDTYTQLIALHDNSSEESTLPSLTIGVGSINTDLELDKLPEDRRALMLELLLTATVDKYDTALEEIMITSATAYRLLQEYKNL